MVAFGKCNAVEVLHEKNKQPLIIQEPRRTDCKCDGWNPKEFRCLSCGATTGLTEAAPEPVVPGTQFWKEPSYQAVSPSYADLQAEVARLRETQNEHGLGDPLWPLYQEYASMVPPKGQPQMTYSGWLNQLAQRLRAETTITKQSKDSL
jgi:hypothetical protein